MKTLIKPSQLICVLSTVLFMIPTANGQILKKLQKKAEQTVERKLEKKTEKETGKAMDSILDPNDKSPSDDPNKNLPNSDVKPNNPNISDNLEVYSKFDYVPGERVLFFDDFSQDFVGDFPSKWNTNASGEVVRINNVEGNLFEFKPGYNIIYTPLIKEPIPEEYTIEFDLLTAGLDTKTSSSAKLIVYLDDNNTFGFGKNYAMFELSLGQNAAIGVRVQNKINHKATINTNITADVWEAMKNGPHISVAVNKNRFRLWINEKKYVDVPKMIGDDKPLTALKFNLNSMTKEGKDRVFIKNLTIAEGGLDLRRTLMSEGRVSTNGILFDSGSANIKPQSLGIVLQISQVLIQDSNIKLNIVGHTDSDGSDDANMKLSKARADAVKNALINIYKISADRLQTDGKGESVPVADNASTDGKAQNRRVEFIKI